jgi:hypothetical protein
MSGYRRGGYRRTYPQRTGRVARANKYAGSCHYCGQEVPAGKGQLWSGNDGWEVVHLAMEWAGSPVSGRYVGGCPGEADAKNNGAPWMRGQEAPRDARGGYVDECGSCGMASCAC